MQIPLMQTPSARFLKKEAFNSVTLAKETVTSNKDDTFEEILSNTQVFNFYFLNKINHLRIEIEFYIWPSLKTLSLIGISSDSVVKFALYHSNYKEILKIRKCAPFFQLFSQLSSLPIDLPNYIGKFTFCHLYYKEKFQMTESAYHLFFLWLLPNLTDSAHNFSLLLSPQNLLFLSNVLSAYIIKIIKLLHNVLKASIN